MPTQPDPSWLVGRVADSQDRLDGWLGSLTERQVREPSALPGWTRAHVLAHIAGNAGTASEMFEGYARGEDIPQYSGLPARREDEIDADSSLPAAALLDLVRDTGARCLAAYRAMPDWDGTLRWQSERRPATSWTGVTLAGDRDSPGRPGPWLFRGGLAGGFRRFPPTSRTAPADRTGPVRDRA
ncbi:MAG: maleylpyruvate isomerase N-terminal domain-containing protein [Geodermatophilaceae bacterium]